MHAGHEEDLITSAQGQRAGALMKSHNLAPRKPAIVTTRERCLIAFPGSGQDTTSYLLQRTPGEYPEMRMRILAVSAILLASSLRGPGIMSQRLSATTSLHFHFSPDDLKSPIYLDTII
jgi:hypothetical protein